MKYCIKVVVIVIMLMPGMAFAYIDPGSASLILQSLLAALATIVTIVGTYYHKIKSFFSKKKEPSENAAEKLEYSDEKERDKKES